MKHDLIVFGEDWQRHPSSSQHVITELAKNHRILWINSIGLRRPRLSLRDARRVIEKMKSMFGATKANANAHESTKKASAKKPANIHVLSPIALPAPRTRFFRWLNRCLLKAQVNKQVKRLKLVNPDLWIALPTAVDMLGHLNERQVIYYCGDDFNALAGVDHQHVTECEKLLVEKADHVLVASDMLLRKFSKQPHLALKTRILPHGVDYNLFVRPSSPAPSILQGGPVAGFYGSIAAWLDIPLIVKVAKALPEWRFVFIGQVQTDISAFKQVDNIEVYPAVAHSELPRYVQHWQVSWLPFKSCKQIASCDPLKLREYLAAGRPIVSTPFPALKPYAGMVTQVEEPFQMVQALQDSLNTPSALQHRRTSFQRMSVRSESWGERAKQVHQLLSC
ncbi:glycosyltransferase [Agarivorans albus]|uniref:Glycosyltransferase SypN n=1 Tax=Agarivorans albus MKT 106 TaxID=1331007 RepID=R9PHG1_AGAAL|nr:glycosyltransferase [Agarivorans albus]GAD00767.1 glycosyltransferase SypN [Agarivorans albus MKT 106]